MFIDLKNELSAFGSQISAQSKTNTWRALKTDSRLLKALLATKPMLAQVPDSTLSRNFLIKRMVRETADTFTMELKSAEGEPTFPFAPGQFNMLYVFGMGEVPISISGDPGKPERLIHTIRAVGTVTKAMRAMKAGDVVGVRGPLGTGWPMEAAAGNDVVIVAGGIGLAPLRSVLYTLISQRDKYGRVVLLVGTRTPDDIPFQRELEHWRGRALRVPRPQSNRPGSLGRDPGFSRHPVPVPSGQNV